FGKADIGEKLTVPLLGCPEVLVAVTCELVPAVDDAADHFRIPLGNPTEREESRPHVSVRKKKQDAIDVSLDAAGQAVPRRARDMRGERGDLEVVLDVDRQRIDDSAVGSVARAHAAARPPPGPG